MLERSELLRRRLCSTEPGFRQERNRSSALENGHWSELLGRRLQELLQQIPCLLENFGTTTLVFDSLGYEGLDLTLQKIDAGVSVNPSVAQCAFVVLTQN
jgi:hypothetical protein